MEDTSRFTIYDDGILYPLAEFEIIETTDYMDDKTCS